MIYLFGLKKSEADQLGLSPRDLDYFVWSVYSNGGRVTL